MKRAFCFVLGVGAGLSLNAQSFSIDWFTIDGGGGTSTNGTYAVSGTIGQPDAASVTTGSVYSVQGGFWSGAYALQTPGAPFLSVTRLAADVIVSWTPATPGFVLQQSATLTPAGWQDAPSGSINPVTISPAGAARFYRLRK